MGHEYQITCVGARRSPDQAPIARFADPAEHPDFNIVMKSPASFYFVAHIWTDKSRLAFARLTLGLLETSDSLTVSEL